MPLYPDYLEGPISGWVITGIFREARCFRVRVARLPRSSQVVADEIGEDLNEALTRLAEKIEQIEGRT